MRYPPYQYPHATACLTSKYAMKSKGWEGDTIHNDWALLDPDGSQKCRRNGDDDDKLP